MKLLKVEALYLATYETFEDVTADLPRFIDQVCNESACIRRWAISAPSSLRTNTPGRRSKQPPTAPADFRGRDPAAGGLVSRRARAPGEKPAEPVHMMRGLDRPTLIAGGFILVILIAGTIYTMATQGTPSFIEPAYLLQQLRIAGFLGVIAVGMMLVILLGHIDLSVPGRSPRVRCWPRQWARSRSDWA